MTRKHICQYINGYLGKPSRGVGVFPGGRGGHETNLSVSHNIEQRDNVGPTGEVLEDLDLPLDLLLLHRLQDLDDAFLVVDHVDSLEHFRVLPAPWPRC